MLGMIDNEGRVDGCLLGSDDGFDEGGPDELALSLGCDVGQSETEGFTDGWLLGIIDKEGSIDV